jgi:Ulp1 family protease
MGTKAPSGLFSAKNTEKKSITPSISDPSVKKRLMKFQSWYNAWPAHTVRYAEEPDDYVEDWEFDGTEENEETEDMKSKFDHFSKKSSSSSSITSSLPAITPFNQIVFLYPKESDSVSFTGRDQYLALTDGQWLNDDVIQVYLHYMGLEKYRNSRVHSFNTFLLTRMKKKGYDAVKQWTAEKKTRKEIDIFTKRAVLFPLNLPSQHWALLVYFVDDSSLVLLDSMYSRMDPSSARNIFMTWKADVRAVKDYLINERSKKYNDIDEFTSKLEAVTVPEVESQRNGYDCGWYLLSFSELIFATNAVKDTETLQDIIGTVNSRKILKTKEFYANLIEDLKTDKN